MRKREVNIIVALDYTNLEEAKNLVDRLGDAISWYKIGSVLYTKVGAQAINMLKKRNKKIFLDLKFYDIPNTVAGAVASCTELGIDMYTLHASGGSTMIFAAVESASKTALTKSIQIPKTIAVTVLTSFDSMSLQSDFGISESPQNLVKKLITVAKKGKADGVVASPAELEMIRNTFGNELIVITPGVRPVWASKGDQKRVMTPAQAVQAGADFLVIGRPITASDDPVTAANKIINEIREVVP